MQESLPTGHPASVRAVKSPFSGAAQLSPVPDNLLYLVLFHSLLFHPFFPHPFWDLISSASMKPPSHNWQYAGTYPRSTPYPPDILPPGSVPDPRKAGWFAGHINHVANAKIQNLSDRFRMDSVARRIQNDQIRLFFQLVHHLEDIPARNSQLPSPLRAAFSRAASTASPTISTPTTFSATGARICAIVPVPL